MDYEIDMTTEYSDGVSEAVEYEELEVAFVLECQRTERVLPVF